MICQGGLVAVKKPCSSLLCFLLLLLFLAACEQPGQTPSAHPVSHDGPSVLLSPTPTPGLSIAQQVVTPTTPAKGTGPAPYGLPPALTSLETQLTQKLFNQINQDRAARGLYPFVWNAVLASGARLHSWNMVHCGFSHTCPDGESQSTRIANEGFAGFTDCGENIGLAGPSNPPWSNVYAVQESMINEPPTG